MAWSCPLKPPPAPRGVLKVKQKKNIRNANRNERSRGRSLPPGHGTFSTSKVGGWWRLAAVGGWWGLAVGGWRLVAVGSGWRLQRLEVGGWWSLEAVLKGCP